MIDFMDLKEIRARLLYLDHNCHIPVSITAKHTPNERLIKRFGGAEVTA